MTPRNRGFTSVVCLMVCIVLLAVGCTPAATQTPLPPTPVPTTPLENPTAAPVEPTVAPVEPTSTPTQTAGPQVGGTLTIAISAEPATLDFQKAVDVGGVLTPFLGAALVAIDKDNNYVPWLAKSWETSQDGLTWTFHLRDDVKFQDGTPLTAQDYVYSFERALDPKTEATTAGQILAPVSKVKAPDATTFVVTLKEPYYIFLNNLASAQFLSPLSKAYVEKEGDNFGRSPMSVGPYKFKEWVTGDHITFERNPDYKWAPAYAHQGPAYIQEIVFKILPETAIVIAGLEAGEIDYLSILDAQFVDRINATHAFNILQAQFQGSSPYISLNVSKWPFDDVKVRQAFSYAVDRQVLIDVLLNGKGSIQYGPLSPSQPGYWPGVEKIGYTYDPDKAKALFAEAGYTAGADGILAKDGKAMNLDFLTLPEMANVAQMLQEQFKTVGVDLNIVQQENATLIGSVIGGSYQISLFGYQWSNADILWLTMQSSQEGTLNLPHIKDAKLDELLDKTRSEMDPVKNQDYLNQVQQYIVEQAVDISMYTQTQFSVISNKVHGYVFSEKNTALYLEDAYIEQ